MTGFWCWSSLMERRHRHLRWAVKLSPYQPEMDALKQMSDVCIAVRRLDRDSATRSSTVKSSCMKIPKSSISAFACSDAECRANSLRAPHFASDSFLHMLSRSIRPLLGAKARAPATLLSILPSHFIHICLIAMEPRTTLQSASLAASPLHTDGSLRKPFGHHWGLAITIESIAAQCHLSKRHFRRSFRQSFGAPFNKFLVNARLQQAKRILIETDMSLRDIASQIGYATRRLSQRASPERWAFHLGAIDAVYGSADAILSSPVSVKEIADQRSNLVDQLRRAQRRIASCYTQRFPLTEPRPRCSLALISAGTVERDHSHHAPRKTGKNA